MLLGDGCLSAYFPNGKRSEKTLPHVAFSITHSLVQKDYLVWKAELINKTFRDKNLSKRCLLKKQYDYFDKRTGKTYSRVQLELNWAEYFRILRGRTHKRSSGKDRKNVEYLLSQMGSDIQLAIWFGDDGSEIRRKFKSTITKEVIGISDPCYKLCTNCFSLEEHQVFKQWFESKYGITPTISTNQGRPILLFSTNDSKKIFKLISPYLNKVESMRRKFWLSFERYLPEKLSTS